MMLFWLLFFLAIENGAVQLSKLEINDLVLNKNAEDIIATEITIFQNSYSLLLDLVQRKTQDTPIQQTTVPNSASTIDTSNYPDTSSRKYPLDTLYTQSSAKRMKTDHDIPQDNETPRTPDQPPILPNPANTGDSDRSGSSNEMTDEDVTRTFLNIFIRESCRCLRSSFRDLAWSKSPVATQLKVTDG